MARNYFTINGEDSRNYGVYISGQGTFSSPARALNTIQIPGRNGDLVGPERRFENGTLKYPAFIYSSFAANLQSFRALLNSLFGYQKLVDSYHPNEFRMVLFRGPFEPDVNAKNGAGSFDIEFECKPQRYLASGEAVTTLTADDSITNPTLFDARPLIRVYGKGTLGIGSETITIASNMPGSYVDIDCEMMDAYFSTANRNQYISLSGNDFPVLSPGANGITLGTGITQVEITPRWFTI